MKRVVRRLRVDKLELRLHLAGAPIVDGSVVESPPPDYSSNYPLEVRVEAENGVGAREMFRPPMSQGRTAYLFPNEVLTIPFRIEAPGFYYIDHFISGNDHLPNAPLETLYFTVDGTHWTDTTEIPDGGVEGWGFDWDNPVYVSPASYVVELRPGLHNLQVYMLETGDGWGAELDFVLIVGAPFDANGRPLADKNVSSTPATASDPPAPIDDGMSNPLQPAGPTADNQPTSLQSPMPIVDSAPNPSQLAAPIADSISDKEISEPALTAPLTYPSHVAIQAGVSVDSFHESEGPEGLVVNGEPAAPCSESAATELELAWLLATPVDSEADVPSVTFARRTDWLAASDGRFDLDSLGSILPHLLRVRTRMTTRERPEENVETVALDHGPRHEIGNTATRLLTPNEAIRRGEGPLASVPTAVFTAYSVVVWTPNVAPIWIRDVDPWQLHELDRRPGSNQNRKPIRERRAGKNKRRSFFDWDRHQPADTLEDTESLFRILAVPSWYCWAAAGHAIALLAGYGIYFLASAARSQSRTP